MRVPSLRPEQSAAIARGSGLQDTGALARAILKCGFEPAKYLAQHEGLRRAGFDQAAALTHFLEFGFAERRTPPTGPLPDGLAGLAALAIPDRTYARTLFRTLFRQQVRHPGTAQLLWQRPDIAPIAQARAMGGLPYVVIGDSHAHNYVFDGDEAGVWLAGMPLVCLGASAAGLARNDTRQGFGRNILRWAAAAKPLDLPVLLKFGGIDAEFRWMSHRIRNNMPVFSHPAFDAYCADAIADYGCFLDRLRDVLGAARIHVCGTFPCTRPDRFWVDGFVKDTAGSAERETALRTALCAMEIPDFATRTALRDRYNMRLRGLCESKGLGFVDAFTPFLDASGVLDARFIGPPDAGDFHMDYDATGDRLLPLILACVKSG